MRERAQQARQLIGGVYRVGQVLRAGSMLTTYTAYNRNSNDVVGLEVIDFPPLLDGQAVGYLLQSLERRRLVRSPHVMRVYDWGVESDHAYIVTDPPRGITLRHILDSENMPVQRALGMARQMAHGLKALHEQGVIGIDLRPQLITVDALDGRERVQLDDVGMRVILTALGYVSSQQVDDIGYADPRYASPEQLSGGLVGASSDLYQLGLLLFELVTGRLPFVGRNAAETGELQRTSPVPRIAQFKADTPALLQELVDRSLAKYPHERYSTADEMLAALARLQVPRWQAERGGAIEGDRPTGPISALFSPGYGSKERDEDEGDIALRSTLIGGGSSEGKIYAFLCSEQDGGKDIRFAIVAKTVVVGRTDPKRGITPDIDLTALDPKMTVSRQHARIRYEETFFYIVDLKSRNKTRLGSVPLVPMKAERIKHGDVVQFGAVRLVFKESL